MKEVPTIRLPKGTRQRWPIVGVLTLSVLVGAAPSARAWRQDVTPPREAFVAVNGARLHYVDWGGRGDTLIVLTGLGAQVVEQFDVMARQLSDRFRVLGLTRRGQAPSEITTSGRDVDTLVADLAGFLDAMRLRRVYLAGHSFAGAEMTRFATRYRDRVSKLVYLDAAVDYKLLGDIAREAGLAGPPDSALADMMRSASSASPDYTTVSAPALNVVVVYDGPMPIHPQDDDPAYRRYLQLVVERKFVSTQIAHFRREMKRGTVLELRDTSHGGFLTEPKQVAIVVPAMRAFLLAP